MNGVWLGFVLTLIASAAVAIVGGVIYCIADYERVAVFLIRRLGLRVYPLAVQVAMLIVDYPEQWSADDYRLSHPKVGSIWIANSDYGIKIETGHGVWHPNAIERRIIREAVDWRLRQYVMNRLELALQGNIRNRISN